MKRTILTSVYVILLSVSLNAQNTLISGDLATAANWDDGVVPSTANPLNNPGIIDGTNTGANAGTLTIINNFIISQTGGDVNATSFGWHDLNGSTNYTISGGNLNLGSFGLRIQNSSVLTISGGTVSGGNRVNNDNVLTMTAGSFDTAALRGVAGSIFNFSGGNVDITGAGAFEDTFSSGGYAVNFSGAATFAATTFGGANSTVSVSIGTGSGAITADTLLTGGLTFDWTTGSSFSLTATTIDSGSTFLDLWNASKLLVDGTQSGTFNDNFQVVGDTLTLIPEPSSFTLLILGGVLLFMKRRRNAK